MEYDKDFLDEVESKVNLVDYIGEHMELIKKNKNYFGHCPLHTDITESFSINSEENKFYCFSCGTGGRIIQYLFKYEGLNYDAAVEKACKLVNINLSTMCHSNTVKFLRDMKRLKTHNFNFKHTVLDESEYEKYDKQQIPEWLNEGIRQKELDLFDIRIDNRSNRIVYPVRTINGELINIKGRTRFKNFKDLKLPKYMNYFPVGIMDYFQGLNVTLPYIKEKNEVIIFESIKSVMKAFGWEYKNCISAEKHTLTYEQIRLLIRLKIDVVFAYDSDVTYKEKEVIKNINILKRFTNVYVINDTGKLLGGQDAKNAPVDCGFQIWKKLYQSKQRAR